MLRVDTLALDHQWTGHDLRMNGSNLLDEKVDERKLHTSEKEHADDHGAMPTEKLRQMNEQGHDCAWNHGARLVSHCPRHRPPVSSRESARV